METGTAKRYFKIAQEGEYRGYSFCNETRLLAEEVISLHAAIAIFCREELGNMNFEDDEECVNYFKSFIEN